MFSTEILRKQLNNFFFYRSGAEKSLKIKGKSWIRHQVKRRPTANAAVDRAATPTTTAATVSTPVTRQLWDFWILQHFSVREHICRRFN
jgi:hypothetical protein